ncbi:MAG TPA: GNAT family N-acetyltransferase [Vicinamibacterales bacterium]|nr:GNAT family N-acetyltransferase [Vicinamibacterales bacterium]
MADIRRASLADAALLARIGAETFSDTFAADNTAEDMNQYLSEAFTVARLSEELLDPLSVFLIAETGTDTLAYARLTWLTPPACVVGHHPMEISRFYVRRPWIGCGIGAQLMRACLGEAGRGLADVIWLGVWEHNHRARAFYARWGFEVAGDQTFVLGTDVQRDLIMIRSKEAGR